MTNWSKLCCEMGFSGAGAVGPPGPPGPPGADGLVVNSWRGVWSPAAAYTKGDLVLHSGSAYLLNEATEAGVTPPNTPWKLFTQGGSGGGGSLSWAGQWTSGRTYAAGSIVEHDGSAYLSQTNVPADTAPPASPWELLAAKGDQGPPGPSGSLFMGQVTIPPQAWPYTTTRMTLTDVDLGDLAVVNNALAPKDDSAWLVSGRLIFTSEAADVYGMEASAWMEIFAGTGTKTPIFHVDGEVPVEGGVHLAFLAMFSRAESFELFLMGSAFGNQSDTTASVQGAMNLVKLTSTPAAAKPEIGGSDVFSFV